MKQIEVIEQKVQIKPYTLTQLAKFYGCGIKTVKTWIKHLEKEIGPRMGYYYTPKQVRIIFEEIGIPTDAVCR